jgi:hypothetical protein
VYSEICNLTPRQRRAALRVLDELTTTNCGWTLYRMRAGLLDLVDGASTAREQRNRARKKSKG